MEKFTLQSQSNSENKFTYTERCETINLNQGDF